MSYGLIRKLLGLTRMTDRSVRVQRRAIELWEEEGRPEGRAAVHWAEAERQIAVTENPQVPPEGLASAEQATSIDAANETEDAPSSTQGQLDASMPAGSEYLDQQVAAKDELGGLLSPASSSSPTGPMIDASLLPSAFDLATYRMNYPPIADFDDNTLRFHYQAHGLGEGRIGSGVRDRLSFVGLVPDAAEILEIEPFWSPSFRSPQYKVAYLGAVDTSELQRRADLDVNSQGTRVPDIDYIANGNPYQELIGREFDIVYSSHNIGHQPDLICHLRDVGSVLRPDGMAFFVIPDKRYCADHFMPESTIGDIMEAFADCRRRHSVSKVIAAQMMRTHNDPGLHWRGEHGADPRFAAPSESRSGFVYNAIENWKAGEDYLDARAWQFTPETFESIITELRSVNLIPLRVVRVYQTYFGAIEFYAILQKG